MKSILQIIRRGNYPELHKHIGNFKLQVGDKCFQSGLEYFYIVVKIDEEKNYVETYCTYRKIIIATHSLTDYKGCLWGGESFLDEVPEKFRT